MNHATTRRTAFGIAATVTALAIFTQPPLHPILGAPGWAVLCVNYVFTRIPPYMLVQVFPPAIGLATVVNVLVWWVSTYAALRTALRWVRDARIKR